jgi:glutathionylspermidine synthase
MERLTLTPRPDWPAQVEELGFDFHTLEGQPYWDESACYRFSAAQVDRLEAATAELHELALAAVPVILERFLDRYSLPIWAETLLQASWDKGEPSLYGRFDLWWDGRGEPRLLEFNADTPTALLEASVVQWFWLKEAFPEADQFNGLHEALLAAWPEAAGGAEGPLHFACVRDHPEDLGTVRYLMDTALQAGLSGSFLHVEEIGWDGQAGRFVDLTGREMGLLFKLYPWEWLLHEEFGPHLPACGCRFLEPPWKLLLSSKALLPILWELHPDHPNLLPAYFSPAAFEAEGRPYVQKPLYGREGANVAVVRDGRPGPTVDGGYGAEGYVYQAYLPLPEFQGRYPVLGSWVVGGEPAGLGIREDLTEITTNGSRFVPHFFTPAPDEEAT